MSRHLMPEIVALALVPLVVALSASGAGFFLVRRLDWSGAEKATAAVALSILLVGEASFLVGALDLHPLIRPFLLAACVIATALALPAAVAMLRNPDARRALLWFALLAVWVVSLQLIVRTYSGGDWYGDWFGHYQRARFFLGGQPLDRLFMGAPMPARPPLLNAFATQVMAVTRPHFPEFQLTAVLVGVLAYFPLLQVARLFCAAPGVPRLLAIMLMFQPMFVQNAAYSWTKLQAAFFVVAALGFYVAGWRAHDPVRTCFAFVCSAAGILVHYSAVPAAIFLALHYLFVLLGARVRPVRDLGLIAVSALLILAPWFAWAATYYGPGAVVTDALASTGQALPDLGANVLKAALNVRDSLVPHLVRDVAWDSRSRGLNWGHVRDAAFLLYEGNLVLALGSMGGALLVADAIRRRARGGEQRPIAPGGRPDTAWFWAGFAAFNLIAGIAVHGARMPLGLAYCAQQPIVYLGVAWIAVRFLDWPRWLRCAAAAGILFDAAAGVLLQFWMESYPLDFPVSWTGPLGLTHDDLMIGMAEWNWGLKIGSHIVFAGDLLADSAWLLMTVVAAALVVAVAALLREAMGPGPRSSPPNSASSVTAPPQPLAPDPA
jgi:hypothetical protein